MLGYPDKGIKLNTRDGLMHPEDNHPPNANAIYNQVWISHALVVAILLFIQNYREHGSHTSLMNLLLLIWGYIAIAYLIKRTCNDILKNQPANYLYSHLCGIVSVVIPVIPVIFLVWAIVSFRH